VRGAVSFGFLLGIWLIGFGCGWASLHAINTYTKAYKPRCNSGQVPPKRPPPPPAGWVASNPPAPTPDFDQSIVAKNERVHEVGYVDADGRITWVRSPIIVIKQRQ